MMLLYLKPNMDNLSHSYSVLDVISNRKHMNTFNKLVYLDLLIYPL
jgi:hypothetical protein